MPFYLQMLKNITQQRDIYDTVIFRFLQIFYRLNIHTYIYVCIQFSLLPTKHDRVSPGTIHKKIPFFLMSFLLN